MVPVYIRAPEECKFFCAANITLCWCLFSSRVSSTLLRQVKIHIGFLKAYYAIRMSVLCAISNLYRDPSIAARKPLLITVSCLTLTM